MKQFLLLASLLTAASVAEAMPPSVSSDNSSAVLPSDHPAMPGHPAVSGAYQADGSPAGHPTVKEANQALDLPPEIDPGSLPNDGKVISAILSNAYVYLHLEKEGKQVWIATGAFPVKEGDIVRYGNGNMMVDFYSKKLDRKFPEILFVSQAVKAK